jgi:hypothetical protein
MPINYWPAILKLLRSKKGVTDHGKNQTDFHAWADKHYPKADRTSWFGDPWCYILISWAFINAGLKVPFCSYVPAGYLYYKNKDKLSKTPKEGYLAFYCWNREIFTDDHNSVGIPQHIGICTKVYPDGSFDAIEGNTSPSSGHGNQSDGDGVYEKRRHLSDVKAFGIPNYFQ